MAENKITHAAPAWLPPKQVFTLEQAAKRLGCEPDYLIELASRGLLRIAFDFGRATADLRIWCEKEDDEDGGRMLPVPGGVKQLCEPLGLHKDDLKAVWRGASVTPEYLLPADMTQPPDGFERSYKTLHVKEHGIMCDEVTRDGLCVTLKELERFEAAHGGHVVAGDAVPEEHAVPSETAPKAAWIAEAREHYAKLKIEHPRQSKQQLAEKIVPLMKAKQRGNKPVTVTNILRYAIQNI